LLPVYLFRLFKPISAASVSRGFLGLAAVGSSTLGVTGGFKLAWVWSAQNRLTLFFATMIGVEAAYFGGGNFFVG